MPPFREFVLKVHSRCDLACDHCYIYEHADTSWRGRPLAMSEETAAQVATRIAEHAAVHALPRVSVILHGGEPLLLGVKRTAALLDRLATTISAVTTLDLRIHTNGVSLDADFLDLFERYDVRVGVSLDGDRSANDLHRRFANGRTSHPQVTTALEMLRQPQHRRLYAGILCTVDIRNDPADVYDALAAEQPPRIDLLLPHATWANPPLRRTASRGDDGTERNEYADWLTAVYDRWSAAGRPFGIRVFDSIHDLLRGSPTGTESIGLAAPDVLVIETDGTLEQPDSLKTAYDGAPATGLDVFRHALDAAADHAAIAARQNGLDGLCATCRSCPVVQICGGGLYAHRYRPESGFDNPSVYCGDLKATIEYIAQRESPVRTSPADAPTHGLRMADFDSLAAGFGSEAAVRQLTETQHSINRSLIAALASGVSVGDADFASAWRTFVQLDSEAPDAVTAVLAYPYVRVWAATCLERLKTGTLAGGDELAWLGAITASAAIRAGAEAELALRTESGVIHLPTLGTLLTAGPDRAARIRTRSDATAVITVDDVEHVVGGSGFESSPRWQARRALQTSQLTVWIEDRDPHRDCYQSTVSPPLADSGLEVWQRTFSATVDFLDAALPRYLAGLRAGLDVLTPLAPAPDGGSTSATARHAHGSVALALPADGPTLGLLLVHEFQHVKLGAMLDMFDLYDTMDQRLYYAPWRHDPRPLEGLLQGTYAHLAVSDYWRVRRADLDGEQRIEADANFARWRRHTADAIDVLLRSGSLTTLGERFVRSMGDTAAPWLDEAVPSAALAAAEQASQEHLAAWAAQTDGPPR